MDFRCIKGPRCGVVISWRIFGNFRENRNAQGQAVCEFSGPADRVYCSQTFVFAKTAVLPIRAPRNLYPAYIVNIGQVRQTGQLTCLLTARVFKNWKIGAVLRRLLCKLNSIGSSSLGFFSSFCENRNAQGQAVCEFSDSADCVYCSQTFVFAKTSSQVKTDANGCQRLHEIARGAIIGLPSAYVGEWEDLR